MNSRTQKLAKQLREALAWSSCRDQLPAESFENVHKIVSTMLSSYQETHNISPSNQGTRSLRRQVVVCVVIMNTHVF